MDFDLWAIQAVAKEYFVGEKVTETYHLPIWIKLYDDSNSKHDVADYFRFKLSIIDKSYGDLIAG